MRKENEIERRLEKTFEKYDKHFFQGFFEDKGVEIILEDFKPPGSRDSWLAYACAEDKTIGINRRYLDRPISEIQNDLLHEMIHLFVCWATPDGRRVYGDRCAAFKELCEDFGAEP